MSSQEREHRRDSKAQGEFWTSQRDTVQEKDTSELGCPFFHLKNSKWNSPLSTKQKMGREGGRQTGSPSMETEARCNKAPVSPRAHRPHRGSNARRRRRRGGRHSPQPRCPAWPGPCRTAQPEHQPGGDRAPTGAVRD